MGSNSMCNLLFYSNFIQFFIVFPVSLPRTLSALRFSSFFGFMFSIYIVIAVTMICFVNREVNPNLGKSLKIAITNFDISAWGIFNSLPLIIFAYMY